MHKQLQLFFTSFDEQSLSHDLRAQCPKIVFINGSVWADGPEVHHSLEECEKGVAYLFNGNVSELPTGRRSNGKIEGPTAGCVIQLLRSKILDGVMQSGSIAANFRDVDVEMREFSSTVWSCILRIGRTGVVRPDGRIDKNYLVGSDTRRSVEAGRVQIADRATGMPYSLP